MKSLLDVKSLQEEGEGSDRMLLLASLANLTSCRNASEVSMAAHATASPELYETGSQWKTKDCCDSGLHF